jgi:general secretion pathway protein L
MSALALFIGADDRLAGWWRIDGDQVAERGRPEDPLPAPRPERVVAIAPAAAMTVHDAELGALAPAQARAAARLLAAETSLAPIEGQHVAVGEADGADRSIAVIGAGRVLAWLQALAAHGLDPDAILPAPLVLPRPMHGYVRATIGGETVLRGRSTGFADDPVLAPLIIGDAPVETLDEEGLVLRALAAPELDLRQGVFARRRGMRIDWRQVKRLGLLGLAILTVTLLIAIVQIVRLGSAADALDREADAVAARVVPNGGAAALEARLAGLRGGGHGFSATAGALFAAAQATPNVELAGIEFASDGLLRATVIATGAPDVEALRDRLRASGLTVEATPFQSENGRIRGELRIDGR